MKEKINWRILLVVVAVVVLVGVIIVGAKRSQNATSGETAENYVAELDETKLLTKDDIIKAKEKAFGRKLSDDEKADIIDDNYYGNKDAKVTVTIYEDFACTHCQSLNTYVSKILEDYKDRVLFVKRDFSLSYPNSLATLTAGEAARKVGGMDAYWKMNDELFSTEDWVGQAVSASERKTKFDDYAKAIGLNVDDFNDAISNYTVNGIQDKIDRDSALGKKSGVTGTPTWIVNGKKVEELNDSGFRAAIDKALEKADS